VLNQPKKLTGEHMKVIVYGSLKRGFYNNRWFPEDSFPEDSKYIEDVKLKGYTMVSLGSYPGILDTLDKSRVVVGELWEVPRMDSLDALEGNGRFYTRYLRQYENDEGINDEAWVYILPASYENHKVIDSGEWRQHV